MLLGSELVARCQHLLTELWNEVNDSYETSPGSDYLPNENVRAAIARSINSRTKSYRYVLPTQLVAKLAEPEIDCHCLQEQRGGDGAFDARTVAHGVTVPFDETHDFVLGGSSEPYVNNPLRVPEVSQEHAGKRKDRQGWDDLVLVLDYVEKSSDPDTTSACLKQTMLEVLRRLHSTAIMYPVPARISLEQVNTLIHEFIEVPSGGDRVQAIATGLLEAAGEVFGLWERVERSHTNAADASTGQTADIECYDGAGHLVLAAETKDTALTRRVLELKVPSYRVKGATEILYLVTGGIAESDRSGIVDLIAREFGSGQNIYVYDLLEFASAVLGLLGERGRHTFLESVSSALERHKSPYGHRKAWAELLRST